MYFGPGESTGMAATIEVLHGMLAVAPLDYEGPVSVCVEQNGKRQTVSLRFEHWEFQTFSPERLENWVDEIFGRSMFSLCVAMAGTQRFTIESLRAGIRARLRVNEKFRVIRKRDKVPSKLSSLLVTFELSSPEIRPLTSADRYMLCGRLRDLSSLRGGLVTVFRSPHDGVELRYQYTDGLRSRCLEELDLGDSYRVGACFSVRVQRASMKLDLFLMRFFERPISIRTFINFQPTRGGTHLEGLGAVLLELEHEFEEIPSDTPLPKMVFETNPYSRSKVRLQYGYVGIMHVQAERVHFEGATREVLAGKQFADFVLKAATPSLKKQWRAIATVRRRNQQRYRAWLRRVAKRAGHVDGCPPPPPMGAMI
jgi:hypothetical protein